MHTLVLMCINQHSKCEMPSFTNYKNMIGAILKTRVVCHPKASI